jgi:hypothetical protein
MAANDIKTTTLVHSKMNTSAPFQSATLRFTLFKSKWRFDMGFQGGGLVDNRGAQEVNEKLEA